MMYYLHKIGLWFKKQLWWRFYYTKTEITTKETQNGRCLICHASIRVNKNSSQPICTESNHPCPCKWNERLIIK